MYNCTRYPDGGVRYITLTVNAEYLDRVARSMQKYGSYFIYPIKMHIGDKGWTTDWDEILVDLSPRQGGTAIVFVEKVEEFTFKLTYPREKVETAKELRALQQKHMSFIGELHNLLKKYS